MLSRAKSQPAKKSRTPFTAFRLNTSGKRWVLGGQRYFSSIEEMLNIWDKAEMY